MKFLSPNIAGSLLKQTDRPRPKKMQYTEEEGRFHDKTI
jgi:hypothetical protein